MPQRVLGMSLFALFACLLSSPSAATPLRLHGSNTIGERLALRLSQAWLQQNGYQRLGVDDLAYDELQVYGHSAEGERRVEIKAHGSSTAFRGLLNGSADIGMASRPVKPSEREQAMPVLGDLAGPDGEIVLALDGLAIIVNQRNPLTSISVAQLREVFSGRTRDWRELGGKPDRIALHARDERSGTWDSFNGTVLNGQPLSQGAKRYESTTELAAAVASDVNAIGFVGLSGVDGVKALAVSDGGKPVRPDMFEVAVEDYPLSRRLFLYLPANASAEARDFVRFALSDAGQQVVEETGFVSQRVQAFDPVLRDDLPEEYRGLIQDAQRLSFNFRFDAGSALLDNKGLRDFERLVSYANGPQTEGRRLMLMGFSDATEGVPLMAWRLSNDRVDYIAALLARKRVAVHRARGFGGEAPVASNDSDRGRSRNRRVEVWLGPPATAGRLSNSGGALSRP
ncbi:MAG: phosphate ABC transporter substrate-binding/OmpA family protein [Lysobacteraceae bacterium]